MRWFQIAVMQASRVRVGQRGRADSGQPLEALTGQRGFQRHETRCAAGHDVAQFVLEAQL